jgi:hypothetical protein
LKGDALLAKTSLNAENYVDATPCRTMLCRHVLLSHDPTTMSSKLHTNLSDEFDGGMASRMTPIQEVENDEEGGYARAMAFAMLQVVINLDSAFGSDSAEHPGRNRPQLPHMTSKRGVL